MFSGKSTELIRRGRCRRRAGEKVLFVNHSSDNRYTEGRNGVVTHTREREDALCLDSTQLQEFSFNAMPGLCAVHIDEAQFFDPTALVRFVDAALEKGISVVVATLDGDFRKRRFGGYAELIPNCDRVEKLAAVCFYCKRPAIHTLRLSNNDANADVCAVGGADMYHPVCRRCWDTKMG